MSTHGNIVSFANKKQEKARAVERGKMNEYTTVSMKPICDCGYIFRDGIEVYEEMISAKINGTTYSHGVPVFSPPSCPKCKKAIKNIQMEKRFSEFWNI